MSVKLFLIVILGGLFYAGFLIFQQSTAELEVEPVHPNLEQEILRAFFNEELVQRKIAHLELSDLPSFDAVIAPRPKLSAVVARFGEPDSVAELDLSRFGVDQRGRVHYYGRLGLVTPVSRGDGAIFWLLIAGVSSP